MPDITNAIVYDQSIKTIIDQKKASTGFNHRNWDDADLLPLRTCIRNYYRKEQNYLCSYCKNEVSMISAANAQIEHIVPKSMQLKFIFEPKNLCVICADCNTIKRDQETEHTETNPLSNISAILYPRSSGAFKIVHPHFDTWDEHILKLGRYYFLDKSPKGAFTISCCLLNRRLHKLGWQKELYSDTEVSDIMTKYLSATDASQKAYFISELGKLILQT